ncbi:MAG: hypothetical protein ACI8WB_006243 [Phenylobacterium sp.]|jgi:hypothetical protein
MFFGGVSQPKLTEKSLTSVSVNNRLFITKVTGGVFYNPKRG